jgi:hypothetical protein
VFEGGEVPNGPEDPDLGWFLSGTIEPNKLSEYLLSPSHARGHNKARMWRSVFGVTRGDEDLLITLIREQLIQVQRVKELEPREHSEDPSEQTRLFRLDIPQFRGPNGNVARVRTIWGFGPEEVTPHLSSAFPHPTGEERRRYRRGRRANS